MSEQKEQEIPKIDQYGKLDIKLTGDPRRDKVEIDGQRLPMQQLWIDADQETTRVEITALKLPTGDPYTVEGYLISEEDHDWLRANKPMR